MANSINERLIKALVQERELTAYAIAKDLNVGVATVDNWIKGKKQPDGTYKLLEPSLQYINDLCRIYGLDKGYILDGIHTNKFAQAKGVPVTDADFTAGDVTQFEDQHEKIIGYVDLAGFRNCKAFVRVMGSSMYPMFVAGDYIGLEPQTDLKIIEYGQPFGVVTKGGQRLIKIIRAGEDDSTVILRSVNKKFDDIKMPKKEIRQLFKVRGPLRDQWQ